MCDDGLITEFRRIDRTKMIAQTELAKRIRLSEKAVKASADQG
jgi:hypothetical protein